MRCFGSHKDFALPTVPHSCPGGGDGEEESEEEAAKRTRTWPSGYSAKTEFNIDNRGNLINGREEALVLLNGLRKMNHAYLNDEDYGECFVRLLLYLGLDFGISQYSLGWFCQCLVRNVDAYNGRLFFPPHRITFM